MLRMRKTDHEKRWVVEEIELGDVTQPLQPSRTLSPLPAPPPSVSAAAKLVSADVDPIGCGQSVGPPPRHATFHIDGLVALTTALKLGAGFTLAFLVVGGPILCCLLTLTLFYLLVAYATKAERDQDADTLRQTMDPSATGLSNLLGLARFVASQGTRVYQRLIALKQSVVNYSLTVSIAESQAMLDLDEIVHGGRRRRRSSLLPCVESECETIAIDSAAVMETLERDKLTRRTTTTNHNTNSNAHVDCARHPVHLEALRIARSQSLPLPPCPPFQTSSRGHAVDMTSPLEHEIEAEPEAESETEIVIDTASETESEERELEVEPLIPPLPSLSPSPRPSLLARPMAATANKAIQSAAKFITQLPSKLQIPVLLARPYPRVTVHRAPSTLTPSQHVRRMLEETTKMDAELDAMLAQNAAFFQAFEDARESLELPRRSRVDDDELSHDALSSGEEEGEFWYEDTLGAEFLDDLPPYLRQTTTTNVSEST